MLSLPICNSPRCNQLVNPHTVLTISLKVLYSWSYHKFREDSKDKNSAKNFIDLIFRTTYEAMEKTGSLPSLTIPQGKKELSALKNFINSHNVKQIWLADGGFLLFYQAIMESQSNFKRIPQKNKKFRQIQVILRLPRIWQLTFKRQLDSLGYKQWSQVFGKQRHKWEAPYFQLLLKFLQEKTISSAVDEFEEQMKSTSSKLKIHLQKYTIKQWIQLYLQQLKKANQPQKFKPLSVRLNSIDDHCDFVNHNPNTPYQLVEQSDEGENQYMAAIRFIQIEDPIIQKVDILDGISQQEEIKENISQQNAKVNTNDSGNIQNSKIHHQQFKTLLLHQLTNVDWWTSNCSIQ